MAEVGRTRVGGRRRYKAGGEVSAHQSWYREHVLGVPPGPRPRARYRLVGNTIAPEAVAADPKLNFIDDAAYRAAEARSREVQAEGGTLEVRRLAENLLSSMPMCFNLFGSMGEVPGFLHVVQGLLDPRAGGIERVVCEIVPTDRLQDRTAFDAMVEYRRSDGTAAFLGIETKYTETFSQKRYDNGHYRSVTETSPWFVPGAAHALVGTRTNQLWRGLMLASLYEEVAGRRGAYVVVGTADDTAAIDTVEVVRNQLTDPDRLRYVSIEQFVDAARATGHPSLQSWADAFSLRYIPSARHGNR